MVTLSTIFALSLSLHNAPESDQGDIAAAAEAFTHGQRAELAHDYARAAEFYELADSMSASAQALRSAAKNRLLAGQDTEAATRAATLLRRYPDSEQSIELAEAILAKTQTQLARVSSQCDRPCLISSRDGAIADDRALSHVFYLPPGEHEIAASFGPGRSDTKSVEVGKGDEIELSFEAPADEFPAALPPRGEGGSGRRATDDGGQPQGLRRLHPAFFGVGVGLTLGLGAVTTWSGLNVLSQNEEYKDDPTRNGYEDGRRAEVRTNILIGGTVLFGAATTVIGAFTRWRKPGKKDGAQARRVRPRFGGMEVRF